MGMHVSCPVSGQRNTRGIKSMYGYRETQHKGQPSSLRRHAFAQAPIPPLDPVMQAGAESHPRSAPSLGTAAVVREARESSLISCRSS